MFQAPLGKYSNPKSTATKSINVGNFQGFRELRWKYSRWPAVAAQGSFTLTVQPSNNETVTIDGVVYTFQTTLTNANGNVQIGGSLAITQQNLYDAINLTSTTGGPGVQYAASMIEHPTVSAAPFAANVMVVTAKTAGTAGNSIATTDTCANGSFDAATLGTTRAGAAETDADSTACPYSLFGVSNVTFDLYSLFRNYISNDSTGVDDLNHMPMAFSAGTPRLMAANSFRKVVFPDWFGRKYKSIRKLVVRHAAQWNTAMTIGAPYTASVSNVPMKSIMVDATRIATMFNQVAGTTGTYLVISTINADYSLTPGTPVLIDTTNAGLDAAFDMCLVNTDKILISYRQAAATNFAATRVASLSGTTITMNALVQIAATALVESSVTKIGTDKAVIAWTNGTLVSYQVVTITGTVPSYGAAVTITSSPTCTNLVGNGTDKAQAFYAKGTEWRTCVVSVSGTTVTLGGETTIQQQNGSGHFYHDAVQVATDKFAWIWTGYYLAGNGDYRNGAFITVSGVNSTIAQNVTMGNRQNNGSQDVISGILTSVAGSEYYWTMGQGTSSMSKAFSVNTTTNVISLPKTGNTELNGQQLGMWRNIMRDDSNMGMDFNRVNRWVQIGTKVYTFYFDAYAGFMRYFAMDQSSLSVYNGETLILTANLQYPGLIEHFDVNFAPLSETAYLKIKNNNAYALNIELPTISLELE